MIHIKRVYEAAAKSDGYRVLVDRLWPRGLTKEKAYVDLWLKEAAPSHELREWFGHEPERFAEFSRRYREELSQRPEVLKQLTALESEHGLITLVFGAQDDEHNQAVVLADALLGRRTVQSAVAARTHERDPH